MKHFTKICETKEPDQTLHEKRLSFGIHSKLLFQPQRDFTAMLLSSVADS